MCRRVCRAVFLCVLGSAHTTKEAHQQKGKGNPAPECSCWVRPAGHHGRKAGEPVGCCAQARSFTRKRPREHGLVHAAPCALNGQRAEHNPAQIDAEKCKQYGAQPQRGKGQNALKRLALDAGTESG